MSLTRRAFIHRMAQLGGYSAAFATMQALGLIPAVGQSSLPQLPADFGKGKKVVILGGGIAGMVSAYELRKAGFDCTILEARNRPGGRCWSVREGTKVEFTDGTVQICELARTAATSTPAPPASHPFTPISSTTATTSACPSKSKSTPPALPSCSLPCSKAASQSSSARSSTTPAATSPNSSPRPSTNTPSTTSSPKRTPHRLLEFLANFGDLGPNDRYTGSSGPASPSPRGAGPNQFVLHKPLKFSELLAADISTGEFYEEQIDWQATMFQPIGGMDRIPYGFAQLSRRAHPLRLSRHRDHHLRQQRYRRLHQSWHAPNHHRRLLYLHHAHLRPGQHEKQLLPRSQKAFTGMPMTGPLQNRLGIPALLGEGEQHLRRHLLPPRHRRPRLVSHRQALLAHRRSRRWLRLRTPVQRHRVATANHHPSARSQPSRPSSTPRAGPSNSSTPAAPTCWPSPSTSTGRESRTPSAASRTTSSPAANPAYEQLEKPEGKTYFAGDYLSHLVGWQEGAVLSAHHAIERIAKQLHS